MFYSTEEIQILYDISMAIGTDVNLSKMVKTALSRYMNKLNCIAGGIYQIQTNENEGLCYKAICLLPRRASSAYQTVTRVFSEIQNRQQHEPFYDQLPLIVRDDQSHYYYIMELHHFGLIVLVKKKEIQKALLSRLIPLNHKLATSCASSFQNQQGKDQLKQLNIELEDKVVKRTQILRVRTQDLEQEITERTRIESQLHQKQKKMEELLEQLEEEKAKQLQQAYKAGIAENAISTLHNIGNALTPAVVNTQRIGNMNKEFLIESYFYKLYNVFEQHFNSGDLDHFLREDPKGKQMLNFFSKLNLELNEHHKEEKQLLSQIEKQLNHITRIIQLEQKFANFKVLQETFRLERVLSDVLEIMQPVFEKNNITIRRSCDEKIPLITIDKNKLVQVLLNILKNSTESIEQNSRQSSKAISEIYLETKQLEERNFQISIVDTGIGATKEESKRAFEFGFSTKKRSSGFGLHDCANFAGANQGMISLDSSGIGKGATVQLTLPIKSACPR